METEYLYPDVADRSTPDQWKEDGSMDVRERAANKLREIMRSNYPEYIDPKVDEEIRERYPILLPREAMKADCGRW